MKKAVGMCDSPLEGNNIQIYTKGFEEFIKEDYKPDNWVAQGRTLTFKDGILIEHKSSN
jgi:hypothetical protein